MNAGTTDTNEVHLTGIVEHISRQHRDYAFEIKVRDSGRPMLIMVACLDIVPEIMAEIIAGDQVEVYGRLRYFAKRGRRSQGEHIIEAERVYKLNRVPISASPTRSDQR
jgi:hypothetical protein